MRPGERAPAGQVEGKLAHRPGLEDVRERQRAAIQALDDAFPILGHDHLWPLDEHGPPRSLPIPDVNKLLAWKYEVVEGSLGRIPEGLRYVLSDPYLAAMSQPFFYDTTDAGREWRLQLKELLAVAFAFPLEDVSRVTLELAPGMGMGRGEILAPRSATEVVP